MYNPFDDMSDDTQSAIRPMDADQEFGLPAGYAARAKSLDLQQSSAEANAMDYLHQAMRKSAEVSPTQGIAAALLAAIPTLGGYLIGKSVGKPNIPEGVYGLNLEKYQTGGAAGAMEGALVGEKSSKNYLDSLDANQAQKSSIYEKMAAIQKSKADRLEGNESAIIQAGLGQQANADSQARAHDFEREMLPLKEQSALRVDAAKNIADIDKERTLVKEGLRIPGGSNGLSFNSMTPEQQEAYLAKRAGVDANGKPVVGSSQLKIPAEGQNKLAASAAFIKTAEDLASQIEQFPDWASYQATKVASGADPEGVQVMMKNTIDRLGKSRSGASLNHTEEVAYNNMLGGDFSSDPKLISSIIRKLTDSERRANQAMISVYQNSNNPSAMMDLFASPPSQASTTGGAPSAPAGGNPSAPAAPSGKPPTAEQLADPGYLAWKAKQGIK